MEIIMIKLNDFLLKILQMSHLYVNHNRTTNKVDILSVNPDNTVDRLCTLDVVKNKVDYKLFMKILKESLAKPLATV